MNPGPSKAPSSRKSFLLGAAIVALVLFALFYKAAFPDYTIFSNDGPYGRMVPPQNRLPAIFTGLWQDLNWMGNMEPSPGPTLTTALRFITTPLFFSKIFAPLSLFFAGMCAWICFRQYKFSHIACLLVAIATALNSDFFQTACWGVCAQIMAFGFEFLALGALADTTSPKRWLRVLLAGFCVGMGVMEAYDIGALFSLFVAAYVVVQSLVSEGTPRKRIANAFGRLGLVSLCAGFIAAAALVTLITTQVKGVVGMGQDAETKAARWNQAVQYSIPKIETIGIFVPGVFGFLGETPDGHAYWGRGGSDPAWDEFIASDGKTARPAGAFRAGAGSNYAGMLVVILAAFAVAQSLRKKGGPFSGVERKLIWFWTAVVLVALGLMWGRFAPFYQFFYALPYASTIRNPAKFHHVAQWALLIVFAYGAEGLCRIGLNSTASVASGLNAHWKSFWAKATSFDRKWVMSSVLLVIIFGLGWLMYSSSRSKLENYQIDSIRLQLIAHQGASPEQAAQAAERYMDSARATARASIGQVGRGLLYLIPTVGLVAIVLSGYFRGSRVKLGGALLALLLIVDLAPFNSAWVVFVNWAQKYAANSVTEFLSPRSFEHRVTRFPYAAQSSPQFAQLYGIEWTQHLFPYYNIQSLDIVQEPRVATDKAAYEAVMTGAPLRRWELSNTRYIIGESGLLGPLNQQFDPKQRFKVANQFSLDAKRGTTGNSFEEVTTYSTNNGQFAIFDFGGALPRAKLYTNWKVSTNDPAMLQDWAKSFEGRVPLDWVSALRAQNPTDLATLHELVDPAFDPTQTVLLSEPLAVSPGTNQNAGEVKFEKYAPKHIVLTAKAAAPSVLLLNDKFDLNWHVTVNGQPAKLLRCNFVTRGVFLDKAGDHRVEFKFQPPLTGLWISLAGVAIALSLLGLVIASERKAKAASQSNAKK